MIKFNLKEKECKNHPMNNRYGVIIRNVGYAGYPMTIVDNSREVVNGKYTHESSLCLIHLTDRIRRYEHLKVFDDFLYLSFSFGEPTYKMYEYKYENLTKNQIIEDLKSVLYDIEPKLQNQTLMGCSSKRIEDDPNHYSGEYVLNDEEVYTILKHKDIYKFYKNKELIYEDKIDFDLYKKAIRKQDLRRKIVTHTNELLDNGTLEEILKEYKEL